MKTLTLELPQDLYNSAKQLADAQHRPVEQVIVDYINLPTQVDTAMGNEIKMLANDALLQIVEMKLPPAEVAQLERLLDLQGTRPLTQFEHDQLVALVDLEGYITVRKAYALLEATNRGILPAHLRP